jgi:hypothetical protein
MAENKLWMPGEQMDCKPLNIDEMMADFRSTLDNPPPLRPTVRIVSLAEYQRPVAARRGRSNRNHEQREVQAEATGALQGGDTRLLVELTAALARLVVGGGEETDGS